MADDQKPQPQQSTPTMSAQPAPGILDRVWDSIKEGIPAFNSKFEAASHTDSGTLATGETPKEQIITPDAGMTSTEKQAHPIATGIAETAGAITSPENSAIIAGTGGFGEMGGVAGKLLPKLLSMKFSYDALKGAYQQVPAFKAAMDAGDESKAENIITHIVLDSAMGAAAGQHATDGVGEHLADTAKTAIAQGKQELAAGANAKTPAGRESEAGRIDLSPVGGVERRGPASFGRTGGKFGHAVDTAYDVMRDNGIDVRNPEQGTLDKPVIKSEGPEWDRTHSAYVDGKKVGSVGVKTDPNGRAQIYGSQVSPDVRGKGLGQKLYTTAIKDAQNAGADRVTSDSTNTSDDANRVWQKLGEKGTPVEPITHPNGKPGYQVAFHDETEPVDLSEAGAKPVSVPADKAKASEAPSTAPVESSRGERTFSEADPEEYQGELALNDHAASLSDVNPDAKAFQMQEDGKPTPVFYSIAPDGEISGVINNSGGKIKGAATDIFQHAVENGGKYLTAWDVNDKLPALYKKQGFEETTRTPYDEKTYGAPSDQLKDAWKKAGWTEGSPNPDVVRMEPAKAGGGVKNIPDVHSTDGANALIQHLSDRGVDSKAVGSVAEKGSSKHDLDLRVGDYDAAKVEPALAEHGFQPTGSSVVTPKEAEASGKNFGDNSKFQRVHHFERGEGLGKQRVDVWHDGSEADNGWHETIGADAAKNEAGGIDPRTGKADATGKGVEIMPERRQPLDHTPTPADFKNFYDANKDVFDKHPELRVGFDNNSAGSGGHEINIGAVGDEAARVAKKLDQKSAFDIEKGEVIPTGGAGLRTTFPNYPIEQRIADLKGEAPSDTPEFEHLSKQFHDNLEPDEKAYLQGNKTLQRNAMTQYQSLAPSVNETTNAMRAGAALGGWWQRYINIFKDLGEGGESHGPASAKPEGLPLYHGTRGNFEDFDPMRGGKWEDFGTHFGTLEQAQHRADEMPGGENIRPAYVNIKNPLRLQDHGSFDPENILHSLHEQGIADYDETDQIRNPKDNSVNPENLREFLEKKGYDGLVYLNRFEGAGNADKMEGTTDETFKKKFPNATDSYVAFRPEQIAPRYSAELAAQTVGPSHAEVLKQWHAAVSGNKSVQDANNLAWHSYMDWLDAGKPTDRTSINDIVKKNAAQPEGSGKKGNAAISDTLGKKGKIESPGLDTTKLWQLVNSPEMKGERPFHGDVFADDTNPNALKNSGEGARKLPSMGATVAGKGNLNRLVIDAHIRDFYGYSANGGPAAQYLANSVHLREAAKALGLKGGEGQEQLWGTVLGLKQLLKAGLTPEQAGDKLDPAVIRGIGKDYAEVIANDPEITRPGGVLDQLKQKYGVGRGSAGLSEANSRASSTGNSPDAEGTGETGVDPSQLAVTAARIRGQISDSKIKTPNAKVTPARKGGAMDMGSFLTGLSALGKAKK